MELGGCPRQGTHREEAGAGGAPGGGRAVVPSFRLSPGTAGAWEGWIGW